MMLRLGGHFVSAGHFANGQPMFGLVVFGGQLFEHLPDSRRRLLQSRRDLIGRQRLVGHVNHRLHHRSQLRVGQFDVREVAIAREQLGSRDPIALR